MPRYKLKKPKNKSHIPFRLNLLLMISFLCFAALFVRLGYIQLYNGKCSNEWLNGPSPLLRQVLCHEG